MFIIASLNKYFTVSYPWLDHIVQGCYIRFWTQFKYLIILVFMILYE